VQAAQQVIAESHDRGSHEQERLVAAYPGDEPSDQGAGQDHGEGEGYEDEPGVGDAHPYDPLRLYGDEEVGAEHGHRHRCVGQIGEGEHAVLLQPRWHDRLFGPGLVGDERPKQHGPRREKGNDLPRTPRVLGPSPGGGQKEGRKSQAQGDEARVVQGMLLGSVREVEEGEDEGERRDGEGHVGKEEPPP